MIRPISSWRESDLQLLIELGTQESLEMEYKQSVPLVSAGDKKEFCKDISAFANAYGGLLIVGIEESSERDQGSRPVALAPIVDLSLKESLQQVLTDGVRPSLDFRIWPIEASSGDGEYLVIEVPKSLRGLHMVTLGGSNRYYRRHEFEAKTMGAYEIEDAYRSYILAERDVIGLLERHKIPNPNLSLAVERSAWLNVVVVPRFPTQGMFVPLCQRSRYDFKGIPVGLRSRDQLAGIDEFKPVYEGLKSELSYKSELDEGQIARFYSHTLFRSGICSFGLQLSNPTQGERVFYTKPLLVSLHNSLSFAAGLYLDVGYTGPLDIEVSVDSIGPLIAVWSAEERFRAVALGRTGFTTDHFDHRFTTTASNIGDSSPSVLRELFDHFWQSFGEQKCTYYGDDGNYMAQHVATREIDGVLRLV